MKTKSMITILVLSLLAIVSFGQEQTRKDYVWQFRGKSMNHTLGLYGGLGVNYSPVMDKSAAWCGARAGLVLDHRLAIGIAGYGLSFDRTLQDVVEEGNYHLESGYSGLFLEYMQPVGNNVKINLSVLTGSGIAQYRYDRESREGKPWYDEIIDRDDFHLIEPGLEFQVRMAGNWWIAANATYRFTSALDLEGADEDLLRNYNVGISLKYGIF